MKTLENARLALLTSIARRQKIANLILLLVQIVLMIFIQQKIDAKTGFFLQGHGNLIYWIAGITLVTLWVGLSQKHSGKSKEFFYVLRNGEVDTLDRNELVVKLLLSYARVTKKIGVKPEDYNLMIKAEKTSNAFATGLSRGKTVCVFTNTIQTTTDDELDAVLAHEFGHVVNRDIAFSVVKSSLGCGLSIFTGLLGFIFVWISWGFLTALSFFFVTMAIILLVTNWASRTTEEFADSFAALYGYGPGLISFLKKSDPIKISEILLSHPLTENREKYIQKIDKGNEGMVPESAERTFWFITKVILVVLGALYLYYVKQVDLNSVYLFMASGGYFIIADSLLTGNSGSWHASFKSAFSKTNAKAKPACLSTLLMLVVYTALYGCGLYAGFRFMNFEASNTLIALVTIGYYAWIAKPIVAGIGIFSDLFSIISDFITYLSVLTSLWMMASFFLNVNFLF